MDRFVCRALTGAVVMVGVGMLLASATPSLASPTFTDVTAQAGVSCVQNATAVPGVDMNGGAAVADYDNDGWTDLFVTRNDQPDILFRNLGTDGSGNHLGFADVTTSAFGPAPINAQTNGAGFGDIDNDGDPDLYVTAWGESRYYLYVNNGDGTFTEDGVARNAALADNPTTHFGTSVAFGDYDRDGYLDLMTGEWTTNKDGQPTNARLIRNLGAANPGHFEDTTVAAGVDMSNDGEVLVFSPRFTDLDGDAMAIPTSPSPPTTAPAACSGTTAMAPSPTAPAPPAPAPARPTWAPPSATSTRTATSTGSLPTGTPCSATSTATGCSSTTATGPSPT